MRAIRVALIILAVMAAAMWGASAAPAQEDDPAEKTVEAKQGKDLRVSAFAQYKGYAEVGDSSGGFSSSRAGLSVTYWKFTAGYEHRRFFWHDVHRLPFGNGVEDPWQDFHSLYLVGNHFGVINERWSYFVGGGASSSFEREAGPLSIYAMAGVGYGITPRLRVRLGAIVAYHPVQSILLPVIGLTYGGGRGGRPEPGFSFSLGFPETAATYRFNQSVALKMTVLYQHGIYKLADDSSVQRGGYLEGRHVKAGLYLDYSPLENVDISVGGGYDFLGYMWIYNDNGHLRGDWDIGRAPFGAFKATARF